MKLKPRAVPAILLGLTLPGMTLQGIAQEVSPAELKKELDELRGEYEKKIDRLEERIRQLEAVPDEGSPSHGGASNKKTAGGKTTGRAGKEATKWNRTKDTGEVPAEEPALEPAPDAAAREQALRRSNEERFKSRTETRDLEIRSKKETELSERIENVLEGYVDITGYFRGGYGRSDEGGPQRAFGIPGFPKYRLGNEVENYGELAFGKTFYPAGAFNGGADDAGGPVARMNYRMAFYNPYDNYGSGADTDFSSPEVWASLANVLPNEPDAKFWAGSRFYRRHDIHINDFYFWDMSGGGAGVEDVNVGNGKLAFAWIGDGAESAIYSRLGQADPLNTAGFSKSNFDLRYYDLPFLGGTSEIGLTYSKSSSGMDSTGNQTDDSDGVALSLVQTNKGFLDDNSLHVLSLQLGTGPAKTFTSGFETFSDASGTFIRPDPDESWRFRATDQLVLKPAENFSFGTAVIYQHTDFGDGAIEQDWVSGGARPIWHLTDSFSLALEGGVDWVSDTSNGSGGTIGKLTFAPQISLGDEFFSRPVLRAFVTYSVWSDGLEGEVGGTDYSDKNSGWTWGVQMESWW